MFNKNIKDILLENIQKKFNFKRTCKYTNEYYLNIIIYILKNGISWREAFKHPICEKNIKTNHYSSVYKTYKKWAEAKIFEKTYKDLLIGYAKKKIQIKNNHFLIIDSSTVYNLFGSELIGRYYQNKKRSVKVSLICDDLGIPFNIKLYSANTYDSKTILGTLEDNNIREILGKNLILLGDKGYISKNETKQELKEMGVELLTYKRKTQKIQNTEEEKQKLSKRFKVENVFSTLKSYKRIFLRYDKKIKNYMEFIYLGCILSTNKIFQQINI